MLKKGSSEGRSPEACPERSRRDGVLGDTPRTFFYLLLGKEGGNRGGWFDRHVLSGVEGLTTNEGYKSRHVGIDGGVGVSPTFDFGPLPGKSLP